MIRQVVGFVLMLSVAPQPNRFRPVLRQQVGVDFETDSPKRFQQVSHPEVDVESEPMKLALMMIGVQAELAEKIYTQVGQIRPVSRDQDSHSESQHSKHSFSHDWYY